MPNATCNIDDCKKPLLRKGMCAMHYERNRVATSKTVCRSECCDKPAITRGLCYGHYSRLRKGQPIDTPLVSFRKRGTATSRDENGNRLCPGCRNWLPDNEFVAGTSKDGLSVYCSACRANSRLAKYGITQEIYDEMLHNQGGVCAICKGPHGKRKFHVDHDHDCCPPNRSCGKCIRGLLCSNCNTAIGLLKDDEKLLRAAITYLAHNRKVS